MDTQCHWKGYGAMHCTNCSSRQQLTGRQRSMALQYRQSCNKWNATAMAAAVLRMMRVTLRMLTFR